MIKTMENIKNELTLYDLERSVFLLRHAHFRVVVATPEEQAALTKALDGAEASLLSGINRWSAFQAVIAAARPIGSRPAQQNQWILAVVRRIEAYWELKRIE